MTEFDSAAVAEPFIVRGHHAQRLFNVAAMSMTPEAVVEYAEHDASMPKGYNRDVYGDTPERAEVARAGITKFLSDFMNLPNETTVRFVAGQKDAICGSCAIGKHCETTSSRSDANYLNTISRLARQKGMDDVLFEDAVQLEGWKKPSPTVELPAWAAKEIISDPDFHAQTFPKLFRPIARQAVRQAMKKI